MLTTTLYHQITMQSRLGLVHIMKAYQIKRNKKRKLRSRELNPGLLRDRQEY
jgi:hypothetical protein